MYRWTKITREEMTALHMSAESAVYFTLKMFMGSRGVAYPSHATIASLTGLSVVSVRKAKNKLLQKGLIVRDGFDPVNQTARFKLPKGGDTVVTPPDTLVTRGGDTVVTRGGGKQSITNKEKENKKENKKEQKQPNPFYMVPRID